MGAQHAREWITPEMVRRLLHHVLDSYGKRPRDHRPRRHDRAVVRPGRQPRRLRLHVRARPPAVAQEPARQRRRRRRSPQRRRRPQPQLRLQVGLRQRGLLADPPARPTAARGPLRARDARRSTPVQAHRGFEVLRQLPLGRRAAALRRRLAGRHPHAGRRDLRGDARRRRQPGRPRLQPRHLRRALHHQRRDRRVHARDATAPWRHAGDVDLRDGRRTPTRRPVGARGLRQRASTSPTTRR